MLFRSQKLQYYCIQLLDFVKILWYYNIVLRGRNRYKNRCPAKGAEIGNDTPADLWPADVRLPFRVSNLQFSGNSLPGVRADPRMALFPAGGVARGGPLSFVVFPNAGFYFSVCTSRTASPKPAAGFQLACVRSFHGGLSLMADSGLA